MIVGDNWDRTINPRFMTMDHGRQSLHYFHSYAALDRIDFSTLVFDKPTKDLDSLSHSVYLPDSSDCISLQENYAILLSRVLTEEVEYFRKVFGNCTELHNKHQYSAQMKEKSIIVSFILIKVHTCNLYSDW